MSVLARLRERTGSPETRFGRDLRAVYLDARRLAGQLRRHAAGAPYPAHALELRRLAEQAEGQAALLAGELRAIAGNPDPADPVVAPAGRNHWERLTIDLAALESLQRRYTELALRWDVAFPASAARLDDLHRATAGMSGAVRAMAARSDPHAAGC